MNWVPSKPIKERKENPNKVDKKGDSFIKCNSINCIRFSHGSQLLGLFPHAVPQRCSRRSLRWLCPAHPSLLLQPSAERDSAEPWMRRLISWGNQLLLLPSSPSPGYRSPVPPPAHLPPVCPPAPTLVLEAVTLHQWRSHHLGMCRQRVQLSVHYSNAGFLHFIAEFPFLIKMHLKHDNTLHEKQSTAQASL